MLPSPQQEAGPSLQPRREDQEGPPAGEVFPGPSEPERSSLGAPSSSMRMFCRLHRAERSAGIEKVSVVSSSLKNNLSAVGQNSAQKQGMLPRTGKCTEEVSKSFQ